MSPLKSFVSGLALTFAIFSLQSSSFAGAWDSAHLFDSPDKTVQTLVVTGNFTNPRLIAELARKETKTPYLLFPAPGDSRIFFNPGGKGPALEIRDADVGRFVEFINPKQIAVLGDFRFVPQRYISALNAKCDTLLIDSDNWLSNATTLGNLLDCKDLPRKFQESSAKLASSATVPDASPSSAPLPFPPPQAIEQSPEPMVLMPPSKGVDEPVLLVPVDSAAVPKRASGK